MSNYPYTQPDGALFAPSPLWDYMLHEHGPAYVTREESGLEVVDTSECYFHVDSIVSKLRAPTDPVYNANVTLQNVVAGSAYWLADANDLSRVLDSGTIPGTDGTLVNHSLGNINAYSTSFLMELRLRKGTSGDLYKPFKIFAYHKASGISIYCSQVADSINSN